MRRQQVETLDPWRTQNIYTSIQSLTLSSRSNRSTATKTGLPILDNKQYLHRILPLGSHDFLVHAVKAAGESSPWSVEAAPSISRTFAMNANASRVKTSVSAAQFIRVEAAAPAPQTRAGGVETASHAGARAAPVAEHVAGEAARAVLVLRAAGWTAVRALFLGL